MCVPGNDWCDSAISGMLFRPRPQDPSLYPHVKNIICTRSPPRSHGQDSSTQRGDRKPSRMFAFPTVNIAKIFFESVQSATNTLAIWLGGVENNTFALFLKTNQHCFAVACNASFSGSCVVAIFSVFQFEVEKWIMNGSSVCGKVHHDRVTPVLVCLKPLWLKSFCPKKPTEFCFCFLYGRSQLRSYSNHSQDTGCTIMDDFTTKANDLFPTQAQIENPTLQPNGLNAECVRATNKRRACATREDKNLDRTRNSQQHVMYTWSLTLLHRNRIDCCLSLSCVERSFVESDQVDWSRRQFRLCFFMVGFFMVDVHVFVSSALFVNSCLFCYWIFRSIGAHLLWFYCFSVLGVRIIHRGDFLVHVNTRPVLHLSPWGWNFWPFLSSVSRHVCSRQRLARFGFSGTLFRPRPHGHTLYPHVKK